MDQMLGMVFMLPWSWAPVDYARCTGQQMALQQYAALYSLIGTIYGGNGSTNFNLPNLQGRMPVGQGQNTLPGAPALTMGQTGGAYYSALNVSNLPPHTHTSTFTSGGGTSGSATGTITLPVSGTVPSLSFSAPTTLSVTADAKIGTTNTAGRTATISANAALTTTALPNANLYAQNANDTVIGPAGAVTGSATGTVSGSTGTGAFTGTASGPVTLGITGGTASGTVTVGPNVGGSSVPFGTVSPYLALNFVIAIQGLYPQRN